MAHIGRKGNHVNVDMRDRLIGENSRMEYYNHWQEPLLSLLPVPACHGRAAAEALHIILYRILGGSFI